MPNGPTPDDALNSRNTTDMDDMLLDVDLRELYLRLRLDGDIWTHEAAAESASLVAYAQTLVATRPTPLVTPLIADDLRTIEVEIDDKPASGAAPRSSRPLPASRRPRRSGRLGAIVAAAMLIALMAYVLLHLAPLAPGNHHDATPTSIVTPTLSFTQSPGVTLTPMGTPINSKPTTIIPGATAPASPTATVGTPVPFNPYLVTQSNGQTTTSFMDYAGSSGACASSYAVFDVYIADQPGSTGTITFQWNMYDNGALMYYPPVNYFPDQGTYTLTSDNTDIEAAFLVTKSTYSTSAWLGGQLVITAINGQTLTTPITSDLITMSTPPPTGYMCP